MNERVLIKHLMELVVKSSVLLSSTGMFAMPKEDMQLLEFSLNRDSSMMEKSKMCLFRIGMIYVIVPFKLTKIEVRTRNVFMNIRPRFEAISKFVGLYLQAFQEQDEKDKEERKEWEEEQRLKAIEEEK